MKRIECIQLLTKRLIIMAGLSLVLFASVFAIAMFGESQRFMLSWAAFMCGIGGGFVSIQQRLRKVGDEELKLLAQSWFQVLLIPVYGGLFALVLYLVFLSEMLAGNLFPHFSLPQPPASGPDAAFMVSIFKETYPATGQDLAKFLFWSFVAGFSERFVPQVISKVTSSALEDESRDGKTSKKENEQS